MEPLEWLHQNMRDWSSTSNEDMFDTKSSWRWCYCFHYLCWEPYSAQDMCRMELSRLENFLLFHFHFTYFVEGRWQNVEWEREGRLYSFNIQQKTRLQQINKTKLARCSSQNIHRWYYTEAKRYDFYQFNWENQYLTSKHNERVSYHENKKFISLIELMFKVFLIIWPKKYIVWRYKFANTGYLQIVA